jgi:carbamoyltransferase
MYILGISCYYHDAAACLLKNGKIVAAAEEERFTKVKHDNSFPINAIEYCLKAAGIAAKDLRCIAFYEKPLVKFERILQTFVETYPAGYISFWKMVPTWVNEKLRIRSIIKKKVNYKGDVLFVDHHTSHAASAFFVSPFKEAAIMTVDGVGEWVTASLKIGKDNKILPLKEIHFPSSLGLLYSTITAYLGFKVNDDEYKVMGLASYGKPKYYKKFRKLIDIKDDGSFELNMKYFDYRTKSRMWSKELEKLFGHPRKPNEKITKRHADIASTLQKITEEVYFKMANHLYEITKLKNLCIAGGVGLNCIANGKLFDKTPFKHVFVQPQAGDGGGALGAAYFVWHQLHNQKRNFEMEHAYYGPEFSNEYIKDLLEKNRVEYEFLNDKELVEQIAKALAKNKVVGWFRGRMEWGPRALGNRSILANPKPKWMKDRVNEIKRREPFRPFAGSVLQQHVHEYFEVPEKFHNSPFMLFAFRVKAGKRKNIEAITHVDGTCRIQTVSKKQNPIYYDLINAFKEITGIPVILNTSFNLKGEPIVCKPEEAYADFEKTNMNYLVLGNYVIEK